jgi:hypothetical protein
MPPTEGNIQQIAWVDLNVILNGVSGAGERFQPVRVSNVMDRAEDMSMVFKLG